MDVLVGFISRRWISANTHASARTEKCTNVSQQKYLHGKSNLKYLHSSSCRFGVLRHVFRDNSGDGGTGHLSTQANMKQHTCSHAAAAMAAIKKLAAV